MDEDINKYENCASERPYSVYRWTESALMCYERNCRCKGCTFFKRFESQPCMMKKTVLELIKKFGIPKDKGETNDRT